MKRKMSKVLSLALLSSAIAPAGVMANDINLKEGSNSININIIVDGKVPVKPSEKPVTKPTEQNLENPKDAPSVDSGNDRTDSYSVDPEYRKNQDAIKKDTLPNSAPYTMSKTIPKNVKMNWELLLGKNAKDLKITEHKDNNSVDVRNKKNILSFKVDGVRKSQTVEILDLIRDNEEDTKKFKIDDNHWAKWSVEQAIARGFSSGIDEFGMGVDGAVFTGDAYKAVQFVNLVHKPTQDSGIIVGRRKDVEGVKIHQGIHGTQAIQAVLNRYLPEDISDISKLKIELKGDDVDKTKEFNIDSDAQITREEMAVILYNQTADYRDDPTYGGPADSPKFNDIKKFEDFDEMTNLAAINYVVGKGLFIGRDETKFDPKSNISYAELMAVLVRYDNMQNQFFFGDITERGEFNVISRKI